MKKLYIFLCIISISLFANTEEPENTNIEKVNIEKVIEKTDETALEIRQWGKEHEKELRTLEKAKEIYDIAPKKLTVKEFAKSAYKISKKEGSKAYQKHLDKLEAAKSTETKEALHTSETY